MFTSEYMRKRRYLAWRAPIICSTIKKVFRPTSVVDFGCSIGDLVQGFNEISVPAIGFDSCVDLFDHSNPETPIILEDITGSLSTKSCFDLALCIEVLRFIPKEKLDGLIQNFSRHSKRVLVGYNGENKNLLIRKMRDQGYGMPTSEIIELREILEEWKTKPAIKAIYNGAMYFRL